MTFKLLVLGVSSALPTISKHQTAHVLNVREQLYLLDAGEGIQSSLKRYDISPMKINHIFISHLHGDHFFGIYGLISTMGMLGRDRALNIYGPKPIKEIITNHCRYFEKGINYPINIHELDSKSPEVIYENRVMTVKTIPLKHSIPTIGYLFEEKEPELNLKPHSIEKYNLSIAERVQLKRREDILREDGSKILCSEAAYKPYEPRKFAYCLDTAPTQRIAEAVKGVDLLLMETTFLNEDLHLAKKRFHTTARQAAELAHNAGVKRLLMTHFSTRYKIDSEKPNPFEIEAKELFFNSTAAKEGQEYSIDANSQNFSSNLSFE